MVTVDLPLRTLFFRKADLGEYVRVSAQGHGTCVVTRHHYEELLDTADPAARRAYEQQNRGLEARRNVQLRAIVRHRNVCAATGQRPARTGARARQSSGRTNTRARGSRRTSSRSAGGGDPGPSGEPEPPGEQRGRQQLHLIAAGAGS